MTDIITPFGTYRREIVGRLYDFSEANNLPPLCVVAMLLQESNLDVNAVGDVAIGGSGGIAQIYTQAHGGPIERWMGDDGLECSLAEMKARWVSTFAAHGGWDAWLADPIAFQEAWTPNAQGSVAWNHAMAARRVGQAMVLLLVYLRGRPGVAQDCRPLVDALTVHAAALDDDAVRAQMRAGQLREVLKGYA